jgi:hypothetical protein
MRQVRIILEYLDDGVTTPTMRWERTGPATGGGAFELLGRAFEVAQREEGEQTAFGEELAAFFKGAMIRKGDVEGTLGWME